MSDDLRSLLMRAEHSIELSIVAADAPLVRRLGDAVRRRRTIRQARRASIGGLAVAAVAVGVITWPGATDVPLPAATIEVPTETAAPSRTPEPTSSSPSAPPTRAEHIDDATVISRLSAPRTGETWSTPEPAAEILALLAPSPTNLVAFRVGQRGDATIYVTVDPSYVGDPHWYGNGPGVYGMFEVDAAGVREILCPSARSTDPCATPSSSKPSITPDDSTFYDTFTLPQRIVLSDDYTLSTTRTTADQLVRKRFGDGNPLVAARGGVSVLRSLGSIDVVRLVDQDGIEALTNVTYALRTPFGTIIELDGADLPGGDLTSIVWDDGISRTVPPGQWTTVAAGALVCAVSSFSVEERHVAQDWRAVGATTDGHRVYAPVSPEAQISRTIRAWHEETSARFDEGTSQMATGVAAGYPFATDLAFHEAHALFAVEGPSGEWQLRLRRDAAHVITDCS